MPSTVAFLANWPSTYQIGGPTTPAINYLGKKPLPSFGPSPTMNTIYDIGGNFYGGDGNNNPARFTAPVNGTYWLIYNLSFNFGGGGSAAFHYEILLVTSEKTYSSLSLQPVGTQNGNYCITAAVPMLAGQSAIYGYGERYSTVVRISGGAAATPITWVAGYLM